MANKKFDHSFYYIYKTTNLITTKIYIGQRSTDCDPIKDDYLGSGKYFQSSLRKHGKENFEKEILEFTTRDQLDFKERFWIDKFNAQDIKIGYNLTAGGEGGASMCGVLNPMFGKTGELNHFFNKHHSEESLIIMREKAENREKVECPWCKTIMNIANAYQYHFDNCLKNPNIDPALIELRLNKMRPAMESSMIKVECPHCHESHCKTNSSKYHFENCEQAPVLSDRTARRIRDRKLTQLRNEELRIINQPEPILLKCPYCGLESYDGVNTRKYHFENCKQNPNRQVTLYRCEHCGVESENKTNIIRWHNDNCKYNPNKIVTSKTKPCRKN